MKTLSIQTKIGCIAVYENNVQSDETPLIFLHGVYFDHHLWDGYIRGFDHRRCITIDMPLHGHSRAIHKADWNLDDCGLMLLEILDALHIKKAIGIGHSWGSMSILRAAIRQPGRFERVLLCNMPFQASSLKRKMLFYAFHCLLYFRNFYIEQIAQSIFGRSSLATNPGLLDVLKHSMQLLTGSDIKQIDRKVIIDADDATDLILKLKVPAIAVKGEEDYVPAPPQMETVWLKGGHVSPLEQVIEVEHLIRKLISP